MRKEIKEALWGPRWFLMGIIIILGIIGLFAIGYLETWRDAVIVVYIITLLPLVIPYILSFFTQRLLDGF